MSGGAREPEVDVDRIVAAVCEAGGAALALAFVSAGGPSAEWVREASAAAESRLTASLEAVFPAAPMDGRAGVVTDAADAPGWVARAICGLDDYARGFPAWCVSAALVTWHGVVAAAVYMPALGDVFVLCEGAATWRTRPVAVTAEAGLGEASTILVPAGGAPLAARLPGLRRCVGPVTAHMLYVARGAASAGIADEASAPELAAALPILRAAGGDACYLSGAPVSLSELLDGRPAPEPVVFAAGQLLGEVRRGVAGADPAGSARWSEIT